ncbi:PilZ domain-containing protein [Gammaproteobacteria bacterium AH-315-M22]|nr:PilZ domain-containing protein [Gammaproteobacteria bacterium AH-315-M22]
MTNKLGKAKVTPKVTSGERRRAQRIANDHNHSHVLLRLHVGDDGQETVHAADVSKSGIGLKAYSPIRIGTPVQLEFNAGDCDITHYGKITWCSKESDHIESQEGGSFRLGVSFESNDAEADTLFYLAVKQRIVRPD